MGLRWFSRGRTWGSGIHCSGGGLEVEVDVGQNIEQVVSAEWMGSTNFANIPILDAFWTFNFFSCNSGHKVDLCVKSHTG